jgi:hypothetical protein
VTRIDTPQLDGMEIAFFNQIDFDTPRLTQFINRTPKMAKLMKRDTHVVFEDDQVSIGLPGFRSLRIIVICREPDWQLSSIEQICHSSLHPLSTVEVLHIDHHYWELVWKNDAIENTLWLQLLLPFAAVKHLYLSKESAPGIAATLQELIGDRIMEVLPNLQNIFVEGLKSFGEKIGPFVTARRLSDQPIAISVWGKDSDI